MPGMIRPKDVISRLGELDQRKIYEMYASLQPRAFENNPLREWKFTLNPTASDLAELLSVLPPSDCADIMDTYFQNK